MQEVGAKSGQKARVVWGEDIGSDIVFAERQQPLSRLYLISRMLLALESNTHYQSNWQERQRAGSSD
jgi:hypothetical protein